MENHELFAKEEQTLATAERMLSSGGFLCEPERRAYATLLQEYRKLFRTTRRLMRLSDHNERELAGLAEKQRIAAEHISRKNRELEILSSKLAKYLSPQVYESIFTGRQEVQIASQRKKLTVFFSDIAGFTEIADKMESEDLTQLLNQYLTEMSRVAIGFGATIDKYVGDAIMTFFGDPESRGVKEDAIACVKMALAMQRKMEELQRTWRNAGIETPLACRVGIHTGYCTVGNFGGEDRMDYTIIGGGVNLASRLEKSAPPGAILISYETHAHVKDEICCEDAGQVLVKGLAYPVATYRVVDLYENIERNARHFKAMLPHLRLHVQPELMSKAERAKAVGALREALARVEPEGTDLMDCSVLLCGVPPEAAHIIRAAAVAEGLAVVAEGDVSEAMEQIAAKPPSLVVLGPATAVDTCTVVTRLEKMSANGEAGPPLLVIDEEAHAREHGGREANMLAWPFSESYAAAKLRAALLRRRSRWIKAPLPPDEAERLQELHGLALLDTPPEERFDRITRIASEALDVPVAVVSLIDAERQWFKSRVGLDVSETPRETAFCAHAILENKLLIVPDTLLDERFAESPLVSGEPHIRFYAGCPLRSPGNFLVGTLCLIDTKPRELNAQQADLLTHLAQLVEREVAIQ